MGPSHIYDIHVHVSQISDTVIQGFSQDFRIGCIGCPIPFHPIALYTKIMDNRVSKIHPDTPLAKGLL